MRYNFTLLFLVFLQFNYTQSKASTTNESKIISIEKLLDQAEIASSEDSLVTITYLSKIRLLDFDYNDTVNQSYAKKKLKLLNKIENLEAYESSCKEIIKLTSTLPDTLFRYYIQHELQNWYMKQFNFDAAIEQASQLLNLLEGSSFKDQLSTINYQKSVIHYANEEYEEALDLVFKTVKFSQQTKDVKQLGKAYFHLGNIYYFLGSEFDAQEFYLIARGYAQRANDSLGEAFCNSNLGLIATNSGMFAKAIKFQRAALPTVLTSKNIYAIGNSYHYLGEAYLGLKVLDSAEKYVQGSLKINIESNYSTGISSDYLLLAKIAFLKEEFQLAEDLLNQSIQQSKKRKNKSNLKEIFLFQHKIFKRKRDFKNASVALESYLNIQDSLDVNGESLKVLALKQKTKLDQAQYELKLAQEKSDIKGKESLLHKKLLWATACFAGVILLCFILAVLIIRKNKRLNKELALQKDHIKKELSVKESLLGEIHHRVKNNLQVISSMLSIQSKYLNDKRLECVLEECKSRINSMSLIHESLYKTGGKNAPKFNEYIARLIPQLIKAYQVDENKIKLTLELEPIELSLDDSLPCGLIINEIVTNSLKHAFIGRENGEIQIKLYEIENEINLEILDNGNGIKGAIKPINQETFGFLLIYSLAIQLEAKVDLVEENGVSFKFSWGRKSA